MIQGRIFSRIRANTRLFSSKPGPQSSPAQPESGRKTPFDSLGYELIDSSPAEPQAIQRAVIDGLGPNSFTVSGVRVAGSVLVMPFFSTIWNVDHFERITPSSLALVKLVVPRPDILVLGTGATLLVSPFLFCTSCSSSVMRFKLTPIRNLMTTY